MSAPRLLILWLVAIVLGMSPGLAVAGPSVTPATPEPAAAPTPTPKSEAPAAETAAPPAEDASASGDLTTLREQAAAATRADPSAANHHREAQLAEQAGDYQAAITSYEAELSLLRDDAAKAAVRSDLTRVREASRGRVASEPASTHRKELDAKWAKARPAKTAKKSTPVGPAPGPEKKDRIVRKWYFWVAIVAIAASAGAVTGIAVSAARDDKPDALDDRRAPMFGIGGPAVRF